ncbi:MAG: DNA topoisomerase IB [Chloroflexota bacterium]
MQDIAADPIQSAKAAGLRYVTDARPGITRKRSGRGFSYTVPNGDPVRDKETLSRIKSLAIPPAWTDVWICPLNNGHIQATGRDTKGRKQYRYHPRWREVRDETKYGRMIAFGNALPSIRRRVEHNIALSNLPREKVLATVVRLLETTLIRVGNEEYARTNRSFGLTTMRNRHVKVNGSELRFKFKGKSGKMHSIGIKDRRLAAIIKRCQELPEQELFEYINDEGARSTIDSADVNAYLKEISGEDFTAKDFRTWAGTILAAMTLRDMELAASSETQAKKNIVQAIEQVSERLGNTPTICRKCYVHPAIIECYMDGSLLEYLKAQPEAKPQKDLANLPAEEAAVLTFLEQRLATAVKSA